LGLPTAVGSANCRLSHPLIIPSSDWTTFKKHCKALEDNLKLKPSMVCALTLGKTQGTLHDMRQDSLLCSRGWGPPAKQPHSWQKPGQFQVVHHQPTSQSDLPPGTRSHLPSCDYKPASPSLWLVTLIQSPPSGWPCVAGCPFLLRCE